MKKLYIVKDNGNHLIAMRGILKNNGATESECAALIEVEENFCPETLGRYFEAVDRADGVEPEGFLFDEVTDTDIKVTFEDGISVWYTIK